MIRLLLDPNAGDGGGQSQPEAEAPPNQHPSLTQPPAAQTQAPQQQQQQPPAQSNQQGEKPPNVQITADQFQAFLKAQQQLTEWQQAQQQAREQAEAERQKILLEKGQADQAYAELKAKSQQDVQSWQDKYQRLRSNLHDRTKGEAIAKAIAGRRFVSDYARDQVLRELAGRVEVHESEDGSITVRQPGTGMPANDYLKSLLDGEEYAHHQEPRHQGGSGANQSRPGQGEAPQSPHNGLYFSPTNPSEIPPDQLGGGLGLRPISAYRQR